MYILEQARLTETILTYDEWISDLPGRGIWEWPTKTEAGRAVFIWDLLRHISESDQQIVQFLSVLSGESKYDSMTRDFTEQVIRPMFDYLEEQIGDSSSVLYALTLACRVRACTSSRYVACLVNPPASRARPNP